jgi:RNA polymerase sigma-70 factor (ECF subfamily)
MPESLGAAAVGGRAPEELSDGELARRIAEAGRGGGVAEAEEAELCRRYGRRLLHFGRRRLGPDDRLDLARDVAQDALLLTLEKLRAGEVQDPERIGAFILGVARTLAGNAFSRGAGRHRRDRSLDDVAAELVAPALEPPDPIARERVAPCVEALPETQRAVVLLSFYADRTSAEVASSLGLSNGNVRVLRHRGVARLRDCLGIGDEEAAA